MSLKPCLAGIALSLMVVACDSADDAGDPVVTVSDDAIYQTFLRFADETFTAENGTAADLSALADTLPDYARLTWRSDAFDPSSGATTFEDLKLSFGDDPNQFGVAFSEAKIWGYDDTLLIARLNGERLDEGGPLFERFDATDMSYFGFAAALNDVVESVFAEFESDLPPEFDFGFNAIESTSARMVLSGVELRPWELSLLSQDALPEFADDIPEEALDAIHAGQWLIAIIRSIGIEKSVTFDTDVTVDMRQPGAEYTAEIQVDFAATDELRGFDLATNYSRGYESTDTSLYTDANLPGEVLTLSGFPAGFRLAQYESYDSANISDMRLDRVMGHVARAQWPSMDERDLLSFGRWTLSNYAAELNDNEVLRAETAYFNADQFDWFIPTEIDFGITGATLSTGEIVEFFYVFFDAFMNEATLDEMNEADRAQAELVKEGVERAIELLPEHGLDTLPFDGSFKANWAADTGPTDVAMRLDAEGYGETQFDLALTLPVYRDIQIAFESDTREADMERAFQDAFAFRGLRWLEEDKGGYDKLFAFAHALGKEYPDQGWGAMLGSMEPAQLRGYLGTMTRMGKSAALNEFPPAADWIEAYATFLESGGSIEVVSDPPDPITFDFFDDFDAEPDPEEIVEIFGLSVSHTK